MIEHLNIECVFWVVGSVLGVHLIICLCAAVMLAFPNVFRVFKEYGRPVDFDLEATSLRLEGGEAAWWIPHPEAKTVVVVCHGRSRGKAYMLPLIKPLADRYNVLAFDFPGHGENRFGTSSLGAKESRTVGRAVTWLERHGHTENVLFGTSMGGASALLWLAEQPSPSVKAIISDGVFARLEPYLISMGAEYRIPPYLRGPSVWLGGLFAGFRASQVNPEDAVRRVTVPGLLLHGDQDPLVPVENHTALAAASGPHFQKTTYPGAHDEPQNPELARRVLAFIDELP
jgi:uncharacterized protein